MATIKRNLWVLFTFLFLIHVIVFCVITYGRWHGLITEHQVRQRHLVEQLYNSIDTRLNQQEMLLNILGKKIAALSVNELALGKAELDEILNANVNLLVGLGFATPDGQLKITTSNIDSSILTHLLEKTNNGNSFLYSLTQPNLVLGKTIIDPKTQNPILTLFKSIRDNNHNLQGVMIAGLIENGAHQIFSPITLMGNYHQIMIIRGRDLRPQFVSSADNSANYDNNIKLPKNEYGNFIEAITLTSKKPLIEAMNNNTDYVYSRKTLDGRDEVLGVARYNQKYELWVRSEIQFKHIFDEIKFTFIKYLIFSLAIQVILYYLFRVIIESESKQREVLVYQVTHDFLTGLPNLRYVLNEGEEWFLDKNQIFYLIFMNVENLKSINNNFGHKVGDSILIELSNRLQQFIDPSELVIRSNGDEFLLLVRQSNRDILLFVRDMISYASKEYHVKNNIIKVKLSAGVSKYPTYGESLDDLLRTADIAMYKAQKNKKTYCFFEPKMQKAYFEQLLIEEYLQDAIKNNEVSLVYQPQVNVNGSFHGVEALVRWNNPVLGHVRPDIFIKIAENTGFIAELGKFIIETALRDMNQVKQTCGTDFYLSINLSVKQLLQDNFFSELLQQINASNVAPESLTLEITENLFIEDINFVLPLLKEIRQERINIAMDDFGTGYSSLNVLHQLPINELKIDKSFVDNILHDPISHNMIKSIISIGKTCDMVVVAEGIEEEDQFAELVEIGCDRFQGYLFSKPITKEALINFIQKM
ncbi:bifunctional diguanylate cyclase/phosphodiesterase [uncultured Tolumonas sp.]|uniref:putative bifunctional diguanylate cyclase/phosphodiesterase n=1 Tax=uncultured Tolumonas sp. TaxID=263765 RepID=UPI00292D0118|nr:bifunctional diguanylate cyclase/phosphodiesterase [uncultured Tolumonas sp.]